MKSQGNSRTTARPDELRTRLQRVLRDELRLGCTDRLVHGGLEGFLRYWLAEIERSESRENFATMEVALSPLGGYRLLDTGAREFAVRAALAYLSDGSEKVNRSDTADTAATSLVQLTERGGPEGREPSRPLARVPLDTPLSEIKGISPARARALARLGLRRYGDLLTHYPTRHERHPAPRLASELLLVQHASFVGTVENVQVTTLRGGLKRTTARLRDQTGQVHASWLRGGRARPFIAPGQRIAISGSVQAYGRQISFENPDWEPATGPAIHTRRLSPIYPLTAGIHPYWLRSRIYDAVRREARQVEEFLPEMARQRTDLPELGWAIEQIHFPDDEPSLEAAHRRLAFDELFQIQLAVLQRRQRWQSRGGVPLPLPERALAALLDAQPYRLTAAQHRVIQELAADLSRSTPMSRLLQGEVGSGKTAVAAVVLYFAVAAG